MKKIFESSFVVPWAMNWLSNDQDLFLKLVKRNLNTRNEGVLEFTDGLEIGPD